MAKKQTSQLEQQMPSWITDPMKKSLGTIESWAYSPNNKVWGEDGQSLYAGLDDLQLDAIGNVEDLASQDIGQLYGTDEATNIFQTSGMQDATTIDDMGRIVDESGYLGAISDYMNPYIQQTLDPVLRELGQAYDRNSNQIGGMATMSGAFGDARHGIMEGQNMENYYQQVGDSTGQAYSDAFNQAMGLRSGDLGREMERQAFNQAAIEQALGRQMQAGRDIAQTGQMGLDQWTSVNDMLFNAGQTMQDQAQRELDSEKAIFEAINNKDYNNALALLTAAQGGAAAAPTTQKTTTKTSSDSGKSGLWGSIAGAATNALIGSIFG